MKKILLIVFVSLLSMSVSLQAQGFNSYRSFSQQFAELNQRIDSLQKVVTAVKLETGNKDVMNANLEKAVAELQVQNEELQGQVEKGRQQMLILSVVGAVILLALLAALIWTMRKRKGTVSGQPLTDEVDHSLPLAVANELTRIEQNLSFMDPKTRGLSQLSHRAAAISAALQEKGYEIPPLVGTQYHEGDNMDAVMEEDESLQDRRMIIRRVTRPCVLYKGKMIQCAKAVVAYNPQIMSSQETDHE